MAPRITVVTAARNAASYLPAAIASIQRQTLSDWRLIVVDDASTDETAAIAEQAAARDTRIEVVRLPASVGSYAAANGVMLRADTPYLCRLDADDVALERRFEVQLDALRASGARACAGAWQPLRGETVGRARLVPTTRNGALKWMLFLRSGLVHSTLMIQTDFFTTLGGYGRELVAEDFRLWGKTLRQRALAVVDEPVVQYRFSESQVTAAPEARDQPARLRIRAEHMNACGGGPWSIDDARDFRYVGRDAGYPVRRAMELLERWVAAWRSDASLDADDRDELHAYSAVVRVRHLRRAIRRQPAAVSWAAMSHAIGVARAIPRLRGRDLARWT